uniref:Glutaredoxin-related protein 5, mitochondrial n=1 Tax=Colobus angolensis palliatus TaxID=336983 RepID=A0A2K5HMD0_COLAP
MSGSLGRAAAALLRWGRGTGGGGLCGLGQLDALVKKDKVVVFLKGTPEQPQCGFSNAVVQILRLHGVRAYAAYNVLDDPELRQGIKDYSNWPTIPQVYLNGEFMHQNGDLVEELKKLGIHSALLDEKTKTPSEGGQVLTEQRGSRSRQRLTARKALPILVFTLETAAACTDHFGS